MQVSLSIIVPVYNSEKTLKRLLDSLLEQTFLNFEILCIDDGSIDNSLKILYEYAEKDSRIRVFRQENKGPSYARNLGLENAKNDFITFADSDDYVFPEMYEKMLAKINAEKAECVCCNFKCPKGNVTLPFTQNLSKGEIEDLILKPYMRISELKIGGRALCNVWNKIFVKDIIDKYSLRFNVEWSFAEDWLFCMEYFSKIKLICFLHESLYFYNDNPNSISKKYNEDYFRRNVKKDLYFISTFPDFEWDSQYRQTYTKQLPMQAVLYYRKYIKGKLLVKKIKEMHTIYTREKTIFTNQTLTDKYFGLFYLKLMILSFPQTAKFKAKRFVKKFIKNRG